MKCFKLAFALLWIGTACHQNDRNSEIKSEEREAAIIKDIVQKSKNYDWRAAYTEALRSATGIKSFTVLAQQIEIDSTGEENPEELINKALSPRGFEPLTKEDLLMSWQNNSFLFEECDYQSFCLGLKPWIDAQNVNLLDHFGLYQLPKTSLQMLVDLNLETEESLQSWGGHCVVTSQDQGCDAVGYLKAYVRIQEGLITIVYRVEPKDPLSLAEHVEFLNRFDWNKEYQANKKMLGGYEAFATKVEIEALGQQEVLNRPEILPDDSDYISAFEFLSCPFEDRPCLGSQLYGRGDSTSKQKIEYVPSLLKVLSGPLKYLGEESVPVNQLVSWGFEEPSAIKTWGRDWSDFDYCVFEEHELSKESGCYWMGWNYVKTYVSESYIIRIYGINGHQ